MLISPRHLVDRLRHPRSRADDLARLRARFATQPSRASATPKQLQLAQTLRKTRQALANELHEVESCRRYAVGHDLPHGRWDGGHCCGIPTLNVFTPAEVASLKLAGTRATKLTPPRSDHAGCAFRGPQGCSLAPVDRPNVCLRYICPSLRQELLGQPRWARLKILRKTLADAFEALTGEACGSS